MAANFKGVMVISTAVAAIMSAVAGYYIASYYSLHDDFMENMDTMAGLGPVFDAYCTAIGHHGAVQAHYDHEVREWIIDCDGNIQRLRV